MSHANDGKLPPYEPVWLLIRTFTDEAMAGAYTKQNGTTVAVDHNNPFHRKWLDKHCWWAARNNCAVVSTPTTKDVADKHARPKFRGGEAQ